MNGFFILPDSLVVEQHIQIDIAFRGFDSCSGDIIIENWRCELNEL